MESLKIELLAGPGPVNCHEEVMKAKNSSHALIRGHGGLFKPDRSWKGLGPKA